MPFFTGLNRGKLALPPAAVYDEQMGITFAENFTSLSYNVTLVQQNDSDGYGPAYLLNGLSDQGFWYQVGVSWDWPFPNGGYTSGFNFNYEVFNSTGQSIFPTDGSGGLTAFSGPVNQGDIVLLNLYISGGVVFMSADDLNTSVIATQDFTANGALTFIGLDSSGNSFGFFTGLMTEQYNASPYYGPYSEVTYSDLSTAIKSATMWIDEWEPNASQIVFSGTSPEVQYSAPNLFQFYSTNGAIEGSNAFEFITGATGLTPITLSYSIQSGGTAYYPPLLTYYSNQVKHIVTLATQPTIYFMDNGSQWSATNQLAGSNTTERWVAAQGVKGIVEGSQTISLIYLHQYNVTIVGSPANGGTVNPSGPNWLDAYSKVGISATSSNPFVFAEWSSSTSSITFDNNKAISTEANISGPGNIDAEFNKVAISLSEESGNVTQGASISFIATLMGINGTAYLTITGLPEGARISLATNPVPLEFVGTSDNASLSVSSSTPPGYYNISITANASNSFDSAKYVLHVQKAIPLTLEFSTNDNVFAFSPIFNYTYDSVNRSISLTQSPQVVYTDNGSNWRVSSAFYGANPEERWITSQRTEGIANSSQTIDFTFYHQYQVTFGYTVVGNPAPDTAPRVSYTSLGDIMVIGLNGTGSIAWVDSRSSFSYTGSIFSNQSVLTRWAVASNETGEITNSTSVVAQYYHQYLIKAGYGVLGGGTGFSAPNATFQSLGKKFNTTLQLSSKPYWVDSNSTWALLKKLSGSSSQERWISANSTDSGSTDSPGSIFLDYQNQYFISVTSISPVAGQVGPRSGWYNSSETIAFSSTANPDWKFSGWSGSGTIPSNGTVVISAPMNETGEFDVGLVLSSSSGGQLLYNDGSTQGTISGGASQTVYVAPGTRVLLSASPSSTLYSFGKWNVGSDAVSSIASYSVLVSTPITVSASFGPNYAILGLLGLVTFGAVVFAMFFIAKRKQSKEDAPVKSEESDDF